MVLLAQDFQPLRSSGTIPDDFIVPSSVKYKKDLAKIKSKKQQKADRDYYLQTNFELDNLLQSGIILFNDSISDYVAKVAKLLLKDQPELFTQLRFYTIRSSSVNAFTTNNGVIFVTLGLMSKIENEAQLAFIIAHELRHYTAQHNIKLYREAERMEQEQEAVFFSRRRTYYNRIFDRNQYSKQLELEADSEGWTLFKQSDYSAAELIPTFDVLATAMLPFEEWKFEPKLLESDYIHFPDSFQLAQVDSISIVEDYDDALITHPNIKKRKENIDSLIALDSTRQAEALFLVGQAEFEQVQTLARQQLPYLHLRDFDYPKAIYNAMMLYEKGWIDEKYYQKSIAQAFYGLAKLANNGDLYYVLDYHTSVQGEQQRLYYLLNKLSHQDLNVLALSNAWKASQSLPEDKQLQSLLFSICKDWIGNYGEDLASFEQTVFVEKSYEEDFEGEQLDSIATLFSENISSTDDSLMVAMENIIFEADTIAVVDSTLTTPTDTTLQELPQQDSLMQYDLSKIVATDRFKSLFERAKIESNLKELKLEDFDFSSFNKLLKARRKKLQKTVGLDIDSVVIINPYYISVKLLNILGSDYAKEFLKSEKVQIQFRSLLKEMAAQHDVDVQLLDVKHLQASQVEQFNDLMFLNDWLNQILEFEDLDDMFPHNHQQVIQLAEKYGTDYFLWTGMVNARYENVSALEVIVQSLFNPLFGLKSIFLNGEATFYAYLINVRTGEIVLIKNNEINIPQNKGVLSTHLYDLFYQIGRKE